jgi:hypothetical protein
MAQTETGWPLSFALLAENWAEYQEQSDHRSAQFSASCRRSESLSSVAPILRTSVKSLPYLVIHPWQRGHLYFAELGDISTLH